VKKDILNIEKNKKHIPVFIFVLSLLLQLMFTGQTNAESDTVQTNVPALKDVYAKDFFIGCLLSYRNIGFTSDPYVPGQSAVITPEGGYLIKYHMNSMSPGNNMKLQYTFNQTASEQAYANADSAAKDSIDTHPVITFNGDIIAQLNWAQRQGFTFRGHNLVWHSSAPAAFFNSGYTTNGTPLSKEKMIQRMDFYIEEIFRIIHTSWPGLLSAFDVVNEAIDDNTGAVRTTGDLWYSTFGDSTYVMTAFQLARKYSVQYGETQIKLYYNDYNTDVPLKAAGIVRLLTPIYQAGLLDGIGMQEHDAIGTPTAAAFIAAYNLFYPICSEMSVTELDCTTGTSTPSAAVLAQQADQYGLLFKCFVERSYKSGRGKIISVSKDGLNDEYTFVSTGASSLWDANNQCKPAFYAVADVGTNYNALDSLITYADSLKQSNYTSASWAQFKSALSSDTSVLNQEFLVTQSADNALTAAKNSLSAAIAGLVSTDSSKVGIFNISANSIDFGNITVGLTKKDTVNIYNSGPGTLNVTSIISTDTVFKFSPASFSIPPSDTALLIITFTPKDTSGQSGSIKISFNAPGSPDSIAVKGKGLAKPVPVPQQPLIVSPTGISIDSANVKLVWHSSVYAATYHVQAGVDSTFSSVVLDSTVADTVLRINVNNNNLKYYWHVNASNLTGTSNYSATASFTALITAVSGNNPGRIPKEYALMQNYPNPFNPSTIISYDLPKTSHVKIIIYDILGRIVDNLIDKSQNAGSYSIVWYPAKLSSGIYIYRLVAHSADITGNFISVKKLLFMK
jgi:endo-1,4-beta-xylanase